MVSIGGLLVFLACLITITSPDSSSTLTTHKDEATDNLTFEDKPQTRSKRNADGMSDFHFGGPDEGGGVYTIRPVPENRETEPHNVIEMASEKQSFSEGKPKTESEMKTNNTNANVTEKAESTHHEALEPLKNESSTGATTSVLTKQVRVNLVTAFNSVLAVTSFVLNILIVFFYKSNASSLSSTLYLRNGVCDLVSALGFLLQVPSVASIMDKDTPVSLPIISYWIVTVSVRMSVFMNCVLGVVRCINILNPFYPVNRKMVNISTVLYFLIWTTIASLDLWFYSTKIGLQNKVYLVKSLVLKPEPGFSVPSLITGFKGNKTTSLTQTEVVVAQFLTPIAAPALLCFALMIFQISHLRQSRIGIIPEQNKTGIVEGASMAGTRKKKESNNQKAATTILLVTMIYVLTSTLSIVAWLVIYRDELTGGEKIKILSWEELSVIFFSSSTLPLLCSTLTPLTLLLRSSAMQLYLRDILRNNHAGQKERSLCKQPEIRMTEKLTIS